MVNLTNSGTTPYTDITLTDNLGAYAFGNSTVSPLTYTDGTARLFVNGVLQPDPTVVAGDNLTVTGVNIPAGGNAVLIYETTVNQYAPLGNGQQIDNAIAASGNRLAAPISDDEIITADPAPELTINKAIAPAAVVENGEITYTFTVENTGETEVGADANAVISDTFNPTLQNIRVTYNGTELTTPAQYTYDPNTGVFATVPGVITVPAAAYTQSNADGTWSTAPGTGVLTVTGTI